MKIIIVFFFVCACLSSQAYADNKDIYYGNPLFRELEQGIKIETLKYTVFEITDDLYFSFNIKTKHTRIESVFNNTLFLYHDNHDYRIIASKKINPVFIIGISYSF